MKAATATEISAAACFAMPERLSQEREVAELPPQRWQLEIPDPTLRPWLEELGSGLPADLSGAAPRSSLREASLHAFGATGATTLHAFPVLEFIRCPTAQPSVMSRARYLVLQIIVVLRANALVQR